MPVSDKEQLLNLIREIKPLEKPVKKEPKHPRFALFAAHHPASSPAQREAAERYLRECIDGNADICRRAKEADADLRVYELDLQNHGETDETGLMLAMAYGMMAVEPGVDCLVTGGFGGGSDEAATLILNAPVNDAPFSLLSGREQAAVAGAIIAARLANIPVVLDNPCAEAAAGVLSRINPAAVEHCHSVNNFALI